MDSARADQFRLRLYGESSAVDIYSAAGEASGSELTTFENVEKLFDGTWHKLALSARRNQLTLYIDCQPVGTAPVSHYGAIRTDGNIVLAKRIKDDITTLVSTRLCFLLYAYIPNTSEYRSAFSLFHNEVI